jgi:predicted dehydrogenase|tara:strand:- start:883 stop:1896 length:1014 start_codon:yes stop_codon:yes gene_type:complete
MSKIIKFAVVGCGHIGKRHMEMIHQNPSAELVAICDTENKETLNIDTKHIVTFYSTIEELLATEKGIDVACICTPNGLHAVQAKLFLDHKIHVVCEKPMGLNKTECEEIIFKARTVSRQVFCVMQNRYSPPSEWLKKIISSGNLGNIYMVQINCYWNRDDRYYSKSKWKGTKELDGGTLFTQFSHFIDIMYWVFGDITNIEGRFKDFTHKHSTDFEDSGVVSFDFISGGLGVLNYSTAVWNSNLESSITVIGEKGSLKIGGQYMDKVEYCHVENYKMPNLVPVNQPNDYGTYKGSAANHQYIIENVIDTLSEKKTATTNALEGLKVVEIIERIYNKK